MPLRRGFSDRERFTDATFQDKPGRVGAAGAGASVCCARRMKQAVRIGLCGLFSLVALAQTQPSVAEILQKVSQTYKAVSEYEFVADLTARDAAGSTSAGYMLFAFRSPNRYRMEGAVPDMEGGGSGSGKVIMVVDGSTLWMYEPGSNECCTVPASELTANAPGDLGDASPAAMDQFMTWRYRGATGFAEGAKFLRDEAIEFGGAKVDCYVVTVSQKKGENTYTWWVDKLHSRILREDSAKSSSVFTTIKLNEPLSDDLFKFEPPPGARKAECQR